MIRSISLASLFTSFSELHFIDYKVRFFNISRAAVGFYLYFCILF